MKSFIVSFLLEFVWKAIPHTIAVTAKHYDLLGNPVVYSENFYLLIEAILVIDFLLWWLDKWTQFLVIANPFHHEFVSEDTNDLNAEFFKEH